MHIAPLNNSVIFKKLFTDPEILSTFLYDLLGVQLNLKPENIQNRVSISLIYLKSTQNVKSLIKQSR